MVNVIFGATLDVPYARLIFKKSIKIEAIEYLHGKTIDYIDHFDEIMVNDLERWSTDITSWYESHRHCHGWRNSHRYLIHHFATD